MQGCGHKPGALKFDWPADNDKRLGMQLLLFRSIARGDTNVGALGKMYVPGSGQNINDSSRAFIDRIFRPMGRELIRHLRRAGLSAEGEAKDAPASNHRAPQSQQPRIRRGARSLEQPPGIDKSIRLSPASKTSGAPDRKFRAECLNAHWFMSLTGARMPVGDSLAPDQQRCGSSPGRRRTELWR